MSKYGNMSSYSVFCVRRSPTRRCRTNFQGRTMTLLGQQRNSTKGHLSVFALSTLAYSGRISLLDDEAFPDEVDDDLTGQLGCSFALVLASRVIRTMVDVGRYWRGEW